MLSLARKGSNTGFYKNKFTLIQLRNSFNGPDYPANADSISIDTSTRAAYHNQTGSICGLAFQIKQKRFFAAAMLKRVCDFGPLGPGGIYIANKTGANFSYAGGFTLQGVVPSNGGPALDFGDVTRSSNPTDDNYLPQNGSHFVDFGRDNDAFTKVGTMSYGGIDADPLSDKIFAVNLFQNRLIEMTAAPETAILNGATGIVLAPFINAYDIVNLPGCPAATGAGNNLRAFGIKIYKGVGYLGIISDAMGTQDVNDLKGYVLRFDPANISAGFTIALTIDFNLYSNNHFHPWVSTWIQTGGTWFFSVSKYPQPIISGIEFNEDGSMDIGIRDRWGDQGGSWEYYPIPFSTGFHKTILQGDLLHACKVASSWILEGADGSCVQNIIQANTGTNNAGNSTSFNNTGREYYADRPGDGSDENNSGSLAKLSGTEKIISAVYDPCPNNADVSSGIEVYWDTQGIQWNSNITGLKTQIARVEGQGNSLRKANVMGDLEFALDPQPIQVGNRIWFDSNGNGQQDADEDGINNLIVELVSPGVDGIFGNGDDVVVATTTSSTINGQEGSYFFSSLLTNDVRKPAAWTGVAANAILPGFDYQIRIPNAVGAFQQAPIAGLFVTIYNTVANSLDQIDSDGLLSGTNSIVTFNTKNVNHNFDFGFSFSILPLKLQHYTAEKKYKSSLIKFELSKPNEGTTLVIERSKDKINFVPIKNITTTTATAYSFIDVSPIMQAINYYRIKEVDKKGQVSFSDIKALNFIENTGLAIYPNPANNNINILLDEALLNKLVTIRMMNATGETIMLLTKMINQRIESISLMGLQKGLYYIQIVENNQIIETRKLILSK
jgi:hypothetical protein